MRQFVDADPSAATRLDADLRLASGDWRRAADSYADLAKQATDRRSRAEALRGQAEALMRMDRPHEALPLASEAVDLLKALRRPADAAYATYWLAYAHAQLENTSQARQLLEAVLRAVRAGLDPPV